MYLSPCQHDNHHDQCYDTMRRYVRQYLQKEREIHLFVVCQKIAMNAHLNFVLSLILHLNEMSEPKKYIMLSGCSSVFLSLSQISRLTGCPVNDFRKFVKFTQGAGWMGARSKIFRKIRCSKLHVESPGKVGIGGFGSIFCHQNYVSTIQKYFDPKIFEKM